MYDQSYKDSNADKLHACIYDKTILSFK